MLRIGELAELTGVTTKTIRHYHHIGLLPEASRTSNGYRCYGISDAVRLLRIRRLAGLGLSLDEVADALADDTGADLRAILLELDAALAADEARIRGRRTAIATLLREGGDLTAPMELASLAKQLAEVFDGEAAGLDRERLVLELLRPLTGDDEMLTQIYGNVLGDPQLSSRLVELSRRFDALCELPEHDPAVDALVAYGAQIGPAVLAVLPAEVRDGTGDPEAADTLLEVMSAELSPAQSRCLTMLFDVWREQSSC